MPVNRWLFARVRRIFADLKQGDSPGRVAKRLTREGVIPPGGETSAWTAKARRGVHDVTTM